MNNIIFKNWSMIGRNSSVKKKYRWPTRMTTCSPPSVIKEMQIKTRRCQHTPVTLAKIQHRQHQLRWGGSSRSRHPMPGAARATQWRPHFNTHNGALLPCDPAIALFYLPTWTESFCPHKNGSCMFRAASLRIGKTQKQPGCPSAGDGETAVAADNGIVFSSKNKWTIEPWKDMEEP